LTEQDRRRNRDNDGQTEREREIPTDRQKEKKEGTTERGSVRQTGKRKIEKQRNRLKHIDWFDLVGFAKNVYIQSVQFCKFEILIQFLADLIEQDLPVAVPNPALLH